MSDHTPTTAEVRERFVDGFPMDTWLVARETLGAEFDAWLSGVVWEARAEQREADARIAYMVHYAAECSTDGPLGPGMRARSDAAREIAAAIRAGGEAGADHE